MKGAITMTSIDPGNPGTAYWFLDTLAVVHSATTPAVIEVTIPPGGSPPQHIHDDLDDSSYLLDGTLALRCGERTFRADAGAYLPMPRGIPHTFRVVGDQPARMLLIHGDDSFVRLIRTLGVPAGTRTLPVGMTPVPLEELERAFAQVGVRVAGESMTESEAAAIAAGGGAVPAAAPDIAELHRRALESTGKILAGVGPGQWAAPTPCDQWDVRALVSHLVSGNLWAAELAAGKSIEEVGTCLDGDLLGTDPLGAYDASATAAAAAFAMPGALTAPCAVSYGPVPGAVYAGHRILDVLVHGWDLAVASGQDARLDPVLVRACGDLAAPQADALRASGQFGQEVEPADAGDAQACLLAVLGRHG
jgi:uncharacterized protein (TIGR03086 family)